MKNTYDRCSRIADLLLIENEVLNLEYNSDFINISKSKDLSEREEFFGKKLTPIEHLMGSILIRVVDNFSKSYSNDYVMVIIPQARIYPYTVDFLVLADFSDDKIIIECDGHDYHEKTKEQSKHDKERDRFLTSQGYKILRFSGSEIYNDFERIEKELKILLDIPNGQSLFSERGK